MNVYRVELMVLDFDNIGADAIGDELHNARYGNDCISPNIMAIQGVDIGSWDDSNPLNHGSTQHAEFLRLFPLDTTPAQPPADLKDREAQEVRAALERAATIARIHSKYPIETEFERGYDQGRKDAAEDIHAESARRALGSKT